MRGQPAAELRLFQSVGGVSSTPGTNAASVSSRAATVAAVGPCSARKYRAAAPVPSSRGLPVRDQRGERLAPGGGRGGFAAQAQAGKFRAVRSRAAQGASSAAAISCASGNRLFRGRARRFHGATPAPAAISGAAASSRASSSFWRCERRRCQTRNQTMPTLARNTPSLSRNT